MGEFATERTKDSLWSTDLFRCESIVLQTHWVLIIMDQFTRRIISFGIHAGDLDGVALCCMFNGATSKQGLPQYLSSDNDPLFRYHPCQAKLRILGVDQIKSIPYTPTSHPFIERLVGTIRREYLDRLFFRNARYLQRSLASFAQYYNQHRMSGSPIVGWTDTYQRKRGCLLSTRKSRSLFVAVTLSGTFSESNGRLALEFTQHSLETPLPTHVRQLHEANYPAGR
jgi:transposase InsO family protein